MSSDEKKESIRAALQELDHPTCKMSTYAAMSILHLTVCHDFNDYGSIGDFSGDDDFKEEIFSARVIQVVMDASQDKEEYPPGFYHSARLVFYFLCSNNTELATTFVANGGVAFLLECLEAFSSDQYLLISCFGVHSTVIESLGEDESTTFVGMTLEKVVDVFELNFETQNEQFYRHYCFFVGSSFRPGRRVNNNFFQRIVSHVWHGVMKHKHDEDAQRAGRDLLRHLVGEKNAKILIDHAEMRHCAEEECAGCA
jgi:hypothetical protein